MVAPLVVEAAESPVLGQLVAAGPRCAEAPESYATVVEAVREGYLLHYGRSRLLPELDPDLRLLIGDHLYARGIERLAGLGDRLAVDELSDLISPHGPARRRRDAHARVGGDRLARVGGGDRRRGLGGPRAREGGPAGGRSTLSRCGMRRRRRPGSRASSDRLAIASEAIGFPAPSRG